MYEGSEEFTLCLANDKYTCYVLVSSLQGESTDSLIQAALLPGTRKHVNKESSPLYTVTVVYIKPEKEGGREIYREGERYTWIESESESEREESMCV